MRYALKALEDTEQFATRLAKSILDPVSIYLSGELGSGKTTFSQFFIKALGYKGVVKSPTFTILESYPTSPFEVTHLDLYRISSPDELDYLGLRDLFDKHIILIEWPSKGESYIPQADISIELAIEDEGRSLQLQAHTDKGKELADKI